MESHGFERIKVIGKGAFGSAVLVRYRKDGKKYVAKEVNLARMKREEREEAKHEIKVLSKLNHPNIIRYMTHFEENSILYIVMEYADGGDIDNKIKGQRGVRMDEQTILNYFVQVCMAMKHLHDKKILHRDLKGQNIFLTSNGMVKLGDFGISTILLNTNAQARTMCGTPYYFSPELCQNKPYNNKSDIWSLGCVLYELVTLKHAFEGTNMKGLLQKIVRGNYPPVPSTYSSDLRKLIDSMLQREPRARPSINSILRLPFIQEKIKIMCQDDIVPPSPAARGGIKTPDALGGQRKREEAMRERLLREKERKEKEEKERKERIAAQAEDRRREAERQAREAAKIQLAEMDKRRKAQDDQEMARRIQQEQQEKMKQNERDRQERMDRERQERLGRVAQEDEDRRKKIAEAHAARMRKEEHRREVEKAEREAERERQFKLRGEREKERKRDEARMKAVNAKREQGWQPLVPAKDADPEDQQQDMVVRGGGGGAGYIGNGGAEHGGHRAFMDGGIAKGAYKGLDPEEARKKAFWDMKLEAQKNKQRALADAQPQQMVPDTHINPYATPDPRGKERSDPVPAPKAGHLSDEELREFQRQQYWAQRAAADKNRQRALADVQESPRTDDKVKNNGGRIGDRQDRIKEREMQRVQEEKQREKAMADVYWQNRREAERNRQRILDQKAGRSTPPSADSPHGGSPLPRRSTPDNKRSPSSGGPLGRGPPPRSNSAPDVTEAVKPKPRLVPGIALGGKSPLSGGRNRVQSGGSSAQQPKSPPKSDKMPVMAPEPEIKGTTPGFQACPGSFSSAATLSDDSDDEETNEEEKQQEYKSMQINLKQMLSQIEDGGCQDEGEEEEDFAENEDKMGNLVMLLAQCGVNGTPGALVGCDSDPLMHRVELLRQCIEENLGVWKFKEVYGCLDSINRDDDEDAAQVKAQDILGEDQLPFLPLITQLIFCEDEINIRANQ